METVDSYRGKDAIFKYLLVPRFSRSGEEVVGQSMFDILDVVLTDSDRYALAESLDKPGGKPKQITVTLKAGQNEALEKIVNLENEATGKQRTPNKRIAELVVETLEKIKPKSVQMAANLRSRVYQLLDWSGCPEVYGHIYMNMLADKKLLVPSDMGSNDRIFDKLPPPYLELIAAASGLQEAWLISGEGCPAYYPSITHPDTLRSVFGMIAFMKGLSKPPKMTHFEGVTLLTAGTQPGSLEAPVLMVLEGTMQLEAGGVDRSPMTARISLPVGSFDCKDRDVVLATIQLLNVLKLFQKRLQIYRGPKVLIDYIRHSGVHPGQVDFSKLQPIQSFVKMIGGLSQEEEVELAKEAEEWTRIAKESMAPNSASMFDI